MANKIESKRETAYDIISESALFQNLGCAMLQELSEQMSMIHYRPKTYICEQGAEGHNMHVIVSGQVRVTRSEAGIKGEMVEREISIMSRGEYFGEVAVLNASRATRTHNVVSINEVRTLSMTREQFDVLQHVLRPRIMKDIALRGILHCGGEIKMEELSLGGNELEDMTDKFRS